VDRRKARMICPVKKAVGHAWGLEQPRDFRRGMERMVILQDVICEPMPKKIS